MESWERAKVWNEDERSMEEKLMKKKNIRQLLGAERKSYGKQYSDEGHSR